MYAAARGLPSFNPIFPMLKYLKKLFFTPNSTTLFPTFVLGLLLMNSYFIATENTYQAPVAALRVDSYIVLDGQPCRIITIETADDGYVDIYAFDIFTQEDRNASFLPDDIVDVPIVSRDEYQLIEIMNDGFVALMDDNGEVREDLPLPEGELGDEIREELGRGVVMVVVMSALDKAAVVAVKAGI